MEKTKVVIHVLGGNIQGVYASDSNVNVVLIDSDNEPERDAVAEVKGLHEVL